MDPNALLSEMEDFLTRLERLTSWFNGWEVGVLSARLHDLTNLNLLPSGLP